MLTEEQRGDLVQISRNRSRELWGNGLDLITKPEGTRLLIRSMLSENTGIHMLDSGGTFGRGWQRESMKPIPGSEPYPSRITADFGYLEFVMDLATYLGEFLTYDPRADYTFQTFSGERETPYFQDIRDFMDSAFPEESLTGIWAEGEPLTFNSYNDQTALSRDFQGSLFYTGDGVPEGFQQNTPYLIFHTHNGADIRGGYGVPHVFQFDGKHDPESLFDWGYLHVSPEEPPVQFQDSPFGVPEWETWDAYRFSYAGYPSRNSRSPFPNWVPVWFERLPDLAAFDAGSPSGVLYVEWDETELQDFDVCDDPEEFPIETGGSRPGDAGTGVIVETERGVHCPITGVPLQVTGYHGF